MGRNQKDSTMRCKDGLSRFRRTPLLLCLLLIINGCATSSLTRWKSESNDGLANTVVDPDDVQGIAQVCTVTAEHLEKQGHQREAILLYERARAHDPQALNYARRLAVLYDHQNQPQKALDEYEQALEKSPHDPDVLNDFGFFHYRQGNMDVAEELLDRALQLDNSHQRAWTNLGIVRAHQGRYEESFEAFSQVSNEAAAHANVGTIMARQGQFEDAKEALRRATELDPALERPRAILSYLVEHESEPSQR